MKNEAFNKAIDEAIKLGGGIVKFSALLGRSHQCIYYYKKVGYAPLDAALKIERMLGVPHRSLVSPKLAAQLAEAASADLV